MHGSISRQWRDERVRSRRPAPSNWGDRLSTNCTSDRDRAVRCLLSRLSKRNCCHTSARTQSYDDEKGVRHSPQQLPVSNRQALNLAPETFKLSRKATAEIGFARLRSGALGSALFHELLPRSFREVYQAGHVIRPGAAAVLCWRSRAPIFRLSLITWAPAKRLRTHLVCSILVGRGLRLPRCRRACV